ncbi:MAG TPA: LacI family DNA-binding transcriptional regulator, partial [Sediminibacterium sp.]|nr:LacI family DNA-binding transcriptional regulator [Sediminibacterium sp.]
DHPDIAEKTKQKVKDLAKVMEYEPNGYAVQLRTRHNNVLGILVPTINNFFYDSFIAAVEEDARLHGYSVLIMQSQDDLQIETNNLNLFRKNMVAGLFASISIATEDITPFLKLNELKAPVIFIDRVPVNAVCNKVCLADEETARMAAEAIIRKGKKKVLALFGHPHLSITQRRLESFQKVFADHSPDSELEIHFPEHSAPARTITLEALSRPVLPDVIFCMGDLILIGVMYAIHEKKMQVPDQIGIISISNGMLPGFYDPKITHVETSGYKLGKKSFQQMLSRLHGNETIEEVIVESVLVEGGSL